MSKSLRGKIDFAEITDTGRVREHNEDAIGSNPDIGLMVLADGMGGYNAGEVASGIASRGFQVEYALAPTPRAAWLLSFAEGEQATAIDPHIARFAR